MAEDRFEVLISRGRWAFSAVILSFLCALAALSINELNEKSAQMVSILLLPLMLGGLYCAAVFLRRRPLFAIDSQGISDYGFLGTRKGFGLVRWEDIECVTVALVKGGTILYVKIKNYDQLIANSGMIAKLFLVWTGKVNNLIGGQLSLPLYMSKTGSAEVCKQIVHFSGNPQLIGSDPLYAVRGQIVVGLLSLALMVFVFALTYSCMNLNPVL